MENRNENENRLADWPIPKLIVTLSLPAMLAQVINVLYNIVDRMYIGRIKDIGAVALTGVGVTFPVLLLVSAFAQLIGSGGAPLAAIELGKKDQDKAQKMLGNAIASLIIIGLLLTVIFEIIKRPLLMAFGASENTISYGLDYLEIYLIGTIFVQFAIGLNPFINCQGRSKTSMLAILLGAVLNIALDPIFIFTFNLGVKGAAIATVISQAASAFFILWVLKSKKSSIRIERKNIRLEKKILLAILALGVSPFIMQITESLINIVFNSGLQKYGGDIHVGAMTIIQSVMQIMFVVSVGMTQGIQPVISYNYGAGKHDRVRSAYRIGFISMTALMAVVTAIIMLFPGPFARIFTGNTEIIKVVKEMMPLFVAGMSIFGIQQGAQCAFVGLGDAKPSFFLACFRKIILLIPLALILPHFMGVLGVYVAEPIADATSAITSGILFKVRIKKLLKN